ncbi:ribosome silencing factor [Desulfonema magnum]|uniref:Ribosomal silencing factor RsfS n=1 Tax=Desulfonema magnum TaxID=45655 RepID=A0A975BNK5_9BACT|nr:ribosome silencing factor [Desulfonema magnum]QTA88793.1 Ribosomal silencing factor [Desulfonema magnum]
MSYEVDPSLDLYVKAALGKKASGVVVLDVHELTSIADVFILCSGRSNRQVTAIAEFIQRELKKSGKKPLSVEGEKEGHWVLLDYGHVIIHVFYESVRHFYDLEGLWTDAKRIKTESLEDYVEEDDFDEEEDYEVEII